MGDPISFVGHLDPTWGGPEGEGPQRSASDEPSRAPRRWAPRPRPDPAQAEAERRAQRRIEDQRKRARILAGEELRQPPEYRGRVFDHADSDGVHPTAFPPMRDSPQDSLSDEFIAFQNYNATTYEKNPAYYCVRCTIRYNAREGGLCGPCIGKARDDAARQTPMFPDLPLQPTLPEYPD